MGDPMDERGPEIYAGAYFDQQRIVNQTEGLQDFRRRQEGHLIIADDRPLLVMQFGSKYSGSNESKYKIEGKYHIPVDYKVIIKWDEDEIVFMTRQGHFGPEFQIVYLPKSAVQDDFTVFDWNPSIKEIWDKFLTIIEGRDDRDMRLFNQGPWRLFGVTRDEVQIALKQGADKSTEISGILYCKDGTKPSVEEYITYLGFDESTDKDFDWLFHAFRDEELPPHYFQYITEGQVYWVDGRTQESTWKHPHYDKYRKMLHVARTQKPQPHWKSIMAFRIEFLLGQVYTMEAEEHYEATGEEPLVETVDNVMEMSRIMGVEDIREEPYFVHVLRRALRHYGKCVREKRKVKDVQDFRNLMERYRTIVEQFGNMKDETIRKVDQLKKCIQCSTKEAVLFCDQCRDFFCQGCFDHLHSTGRRQNHRRTWVEMGMCAECQESIALFHCVQCADLYCRDCFQQWHIRGGRRNHIPIILRSFNAKSDMLPDATPAMGTAAPMIVKKAYSPWFSFKDENNINLYWNIHTGEQRRDMPLEILNEPIEDGVGGGMNCGWSGSWGGNMYPDHLDNTNAGSRGRKSGPFEGTM